MTTSPLDFFTLDPDSDLPATANTCPRCGQTQCTCGRHNAMTDCSCERCRVALTCDDATTA